MDHTDKALLSWLHQNNECNPRFCGECLKKTKDRKPVDARRFAFDLKDEDAKWVNPNGSKM